MASMVIIIMIIIIIVGYREFLEFLIRDGDVLLPFQT